ncbi:FMN-binding glutamate synthase family protein [Candidatus Ichthyocystis hellenicum]|uniref:FMN-binding glutamate synthase family protein n=1 Tax=Candidatus Ichthyocystis hellenicum TaxID=1561003 RepID=UPI000ABDFCB4|nr:FMN-binding glutamate synthase family protein [Candidatus Ichthyocystis hellenicum]
MSLIDILEHIAAFIVSAPFFVIILLILIVYLYDILQKKHTVLRNFPVIGHFRYILEKQGDYLRQYFFSGDREEMPFDRSTRSWIYRMAKDEDKVIAFGSTYDIKKEGAIIFSNAVFSVHMQDVVPVPAISIGEGYCDSPFETKSLINISGMSYGALSKPAIQALSRGAAESGCWLNTGEGGVSPYHLEGNADLIAQIGTALYGFRDQEGNFSWTRLEEVAKNSSVKAFEIKLSQGAKPGKGGLLPALKVTEEIAKIRCIQAYKDSVSPNCHRLINSVDSLLDWVVKIRDTTRKPVGIKTALGGYDFLQDLFSAIQRRGLQDAPDFLVIDGGEGGTGAAPQSLMDFMGLSIREILPITVDLMNQFDLKKRIVLVASGKLATPADVAWALCMGADFVNSARGFLFSLGCIQAMRCHTNCCPTGITTHNVRLQRGLVVAEKYLRVAQYVRNLNKEVEQIAHSCGVVHPRMLRRHHVRLVRNHSSISYADLFPESTKN